VAERVSKRRGRRVFPPGKEGCQVFLRDL